MPNHIGGPANSENVVPKFAAVRNPTNFVLVGGASGFMGPGNWRARRRLQRRDDYRRSAAIIHASGTIPRRSIRFVFFTGEEQGMLGSAAYAHAHRAELDRMIAAVIFGLRSRAASPAIPWVDAKDIVSAVRATLEPLKPLDVMDLTLERRHGHRQLRFYSRRRGPRWRPIRSGPTICLNYHAASDTFDKVDFKELKHNAGNRSSKQPMPSRTAKSASAPPVARSNRRIAEADRPRQRK